MPKKKPVEKKVVEVVEVEEEEVTCPVCGKPVGLDIASCPYCGAEFEEEEIEEIVEGVEKEAPAEKGLEAAVEEGPTEEEEETAECPVCGRMVSLAVSSCPNCGAEFEEEEIEEVIEVVEPEETPVARPVARQAEEAEEELEVLVEEQEEPAGATVGPPTSIMDLRVIGISLIILGILGSQISFMIDWYWTWVPPIEDNLVMFIAITVVVIVAGFAVFMVMKRKGVYRKRTASSMLPGVALSIFLFGILALIMVMLWNPINAALQNSNLGVGGAFIAMLVFGVLAVFMGSRMATPRGSY